MNTALMITILLLASCSGLQPRFHRVVSGETLTKIAKQYDVEESELKDYNRESLSMGARAGLKLYIPFEENPKWNVSDRVIRTKTEEPNEENIKGQAASYEIPLMRYMWPVSGKLSSHFGKRHGNFHEGIDIAARKGTPIKASRAGHVIYASNGISGYGNLVILRHSDAYSTVYAHLSKFGVKKGQFVARGQKIGLVGATGHATSPHLHFEIRKGQIPLDPLTYLHGQMLAKY